MPSSRETHLGYHLSHPAPEELGEVQEVLGIHTASSFIVQVKNPLAPPTGSAQVGLPSSRRAQYPEEFLTSVGQLFQQPFSSFALGAEAA